MPVLILLALGALVVLGAAAKRARATPGQVAGAVLGVLLAGGAAAVIGPFFLMSLFLDPHGSEGAQLGAAFGAFAYTVPLVLLAAPLGLPLAHAGQRADWQAVGAGYLGALAGLVPSVAACAVFRVPVFLVVPFVLIGAAAGYFNAWGARQLGADGAPPPSAG